MQTQPRRRKGTHEKSGKKGRSRQRSKQNKNDSGNNANSSDTDEKTQKIHGSKTQTGIEHKNRHNSNKHNANQLCQTINNIPTNALNDCIPTNKLCKDFKIPAMSKLGKLTKTSKKSKHYSSKKNLQNNNHLEKQYLTNKIELIADLILLFVGIIYIILCPFTKVEESFNMQASHDIMFESTNLENYDHLLYPGMFCSVLFCFKYFAYL